MIPSQNLPQGSLYLITDLLPGEFTLLRVGLIQSMANRVRGDKKPLNILETSTNLRALNHFFGKRRGPIGKAVVHGSLPDFVAQCPYSTVFFLLSLIEHTVIQLSY